MALKLIFTPMKTFSLSLTLLAALVYFSMRETNLEYIISRIEINGATRVQFSALNDSADYTKIGDSDLKKIDIDLAMQNLNRISAAFISNDGTYVITFAKSSGDIIKRVLFINGQIRMDNVQSVSKNRIATTYGEIQSISAMTNSEN